jgi:hypothetical protein
MNVNRLGGCGDVRNIYKVLIWKPQEKRSLRRSRSRWENNIEINLKETDE